MSDHVKLHGMLVRHEGLRLKPYRCTKGKLTIGVGRNIEELGISNAEAMMMLDNDIERNRRDAERTFPWFYKLSPTRQDVIIDMLFMGLPRFLGFKKMIAALAAGDYDRAASEILNSTWAAEVGARAAELAEMTRDGDYP